MKRICTFFLLLSLASCEVFGTEDCDDDMNDTKMRYGEPIRTSNQDFRDDQVETWHYSNQSITFLWGESYENCEVSTFRVSN